jgi:hypothetical protein
MQNTISNPANPANQPPNTAESGDISARARADRRIDAQTISEVARLCAKGLTESEACRRLGVKPRHWFDWKTRHNRLEKFNELLEAFRADRIDSLIEKIEKSADGKGLKQPDWRAAAHLLSIADARRFSEGGMRASLEVNLNVSPLGNGSIEAVRAAIARVQATQPSPTPALPAAGASPPLADVVDVKQLTDAKPENA